MEMPQFKGDDVQIFNNKQEPMYKAREVATRSLVGLYGSELLLFAGVLLIFLNNMNVLAPGTYFGQYSWVMSVVFSIGLIINFISIPFLYYSSFSNFKNENDHWDRETFWILPLFFFGTFFLYGSEVFFSLSLVVVSLLTIAFVHFRFIRLSRRFLITSTNQELESHQRYFTSLNYLTAYYILLLIVLIFLDPIQKTFMFVRINL